VMRHDFATRELPGHGLKAVARHLGVAGVLVPPAPGVLCAMGVLVNDLQTDVSRTRIVAEHSAGCTATVDRVYRELEEKAAQVFGARPGFERTADARYAGQNHELTVDVPAGRFDDAALAIVKKNFHRAHRELYGYASPERPLELVTFRVRARLATGRPELDGAQAKARAGALVPVATRKVYFDEAGGYIDCPIYERNALRPGDELKGPAIVEQMDATTVIPPDFTGRIDDMFNLLLRPT